MLLTSSVCQDGQTGYFPGTLRERSTQLLHHGGVPIHKIVKEILPTCPEFDGAIGGSDEPASVQKHGCTVCGCKDVLAHVRLGHVAKISRNDKNIGNGVDLGVGHDVARLWIAKLSRRIVLMNNAMRQIAILIIVTGFLFVAGATVEDIEGARAASTDD